VKFPHSPTTVILQPRIGDQFWIGEVEMIKEGGINAPPWVLVVKALGEERSWPVEIFDEISPGQWEGLLWNEEGEHHVPFRVRQTLPRDAEVAMSMQGSGLQIPMPIELIDHIHSSSGDFTMPQLFALTDDDGFVATMLLSAPTGLYVRYSSMWHPVTDNTVIENLNVHEVAATALDLFDEREREGQLPAVTSMLTGKNPGEMVEITGAPLEPGEATVETERVVTASGSVLTVPALRRPEDAAEAIAAAADNPDLQWWVERRLAALGLEVDVPWS
jgi:hypothetical protein